MKLKLGGYFLGPMLHHPIFFKRKSVSHLNHEPSFGYRCYRQRLLSCVSSRTLVTLIASFKSAWWNILGRLECHLYSCAHASNLSSVGPPNSTTRKEPDNWGGEDATFYVLPSQKPSIVHTESSQVLVLWEHITCCCSCAISHHTLQVVSNDWY